MGLLINFIRFELLRPYFFDEIFCCSPSNFAMERPTVPKPAIAIFNFRRRAAGLGGAPGFVRAFDFVRFVLAAKSHLAGNRNPPGMDRAERKDYKVFSVGRACSLSPFVAASKHLSCDLL